jgi:uncharacterized protein (DUF58 family)
VTPLRWEAVIDRDVEGRLSQLCRWILDLEGKNLLYSLSIPGTDIAPGTGEQHRCQCLEALALYQDAPVDA